MAQRKSDTQFLSFYSFTAGFAQTTFYVLGTVVAVWANWQFLLERSQTEDRRSRFDVFLTVSIALCYTLALLLTYSGTRMEAEIAIRFARDDTWYV